MTQETRLVRAFIALALAGSLAGCGLFGGGDSRGPGKTYIEIPQPSAAPAAAPAPAPAPAPK